MLYLYDCRNVDGTNEHNCNVPRIHWTRCSRSDNVQKCKYSVQNWIAFCDPMAMVSMFVSWSKNEINQSLVFLLASAYLDICGQTWTISEPFRDNVLQILLVGTRYQTLHIVTVLQNRHLVILWTTALYQDFLAVLLLYISLVVRQSSGSACSANDKKKKKKEWDLLERTGVHGAILWT